MVELDEGSFPWPVSNFKDIRHRNSRFYAAEVEAERVEWDPNIEVSIPESLSTVLIHLANVIDEIGLCGDTTDKNSGSGVDGLCLGRYSAVYSL